MSEVASPGSAQQHRDAAPQQIRAAIVTISDTRTTETDESGQYLYDRLRAGGHEVVGRVIVPDDAVQIRSAVVQLMRQAQVVLTTGGTGITGRDVTVPVIESLLTKPIPGFGELFRMLSYAEVKGAAMLSRATGGVGRGSLVFAMPGSLNAVKLAWDGILEGELGHLVYELTRQGQLHAPAAPPKEELFTDLPAPLPALDELPGQARPVAETTGPQLPAPAWGGEFKGVELKGAEAGPLGRQAEGQTMTVSAAPGALSSEGSSVPAAPIKLGRHSQHPTTYERTPLIRPDDLQPDKNKEPGF